MPKMLTKAEKKAYIERSGTCPYCKKSNIDGDEYNYENGEEVTQLVTCLECGRQWTEIWKLDRIEEKLPEPQTKTACPKCGHTTFLASQLVTGTIAVKVMLDRQERPTFLGNVGGSPTGDPDLSGLDFRTPEPPFRCERCDHVLD